MQLTKLLAVSLAVAPSLVSAALFPKDSLVKMSSPKEFKAIMKENVRLPHVVRFGYNLMMIVDHQCLRVRRTVVWSECLQKSVWRITYTDYLPNSEIALSENGTRV